MYSMGLAMLTGTVPATQLGRYLSREIGWLTDEVPRSAQRMKQVFNGWVRFRADQMLPALSSWTPLGCVSPGFALVRTQFQAAIPGYCAIRKSVHAESS